MQCLSKEVALQIAHQACDSKGFSFEEPVTVVDKGKSFAVWTKSNCTDAGVSIQIDKNSGQVTYIGKSPRSFDTSDASFWKPLEQGDKH